MKEYLEMYHHYVLLEIEGTKNINLRRGYLEIQIELSKPRVHVLELF